MTQHQTSYATGSRTRAPAIDEGLRTHMNKVYGTMSAGLVITAASAWAIAGLSVTPDPSLAAGTLGADTHLTGLGALLYLTPVKWLMIFAPLLFLFVIGGVARYGSAAATQLAFHAYAAVMGVSLSSIFLVYSGLSIAQTFLITAAAFAGLSLWGYSTRRDISAWGGFLIMGLIGLILASVVNLFLASSALEFAVSVLGVLIFAGLTAYDTQKIKLDYLAHAEAGDADWLAKSAVMGALTLYLDFINLFLHLLSFFGNRE